MAHSFNNLKSLSCFSSKFLAKFSLAFCLSVTAANLAIADDGSFAEDVKAVSKIAPKAGHKANKINRVSDGEGGKVGAIKRALANLLPDENIGVSLVNNTVALTGQASSAEALQNAIKIASEYVNNGSDQGQILNLVTVEAKQVMLKVKIGEMKREQLQQFGLGLHGIISGGQAAIGALEAKGAFKTLAEPTLTAVAGESANFLAGGEFPVPVVQSGNVMSVDYKKFGVNLDFTPLTVTDKKVRFNVASEVSEISDLATLKAQSQSSYPIRVPSLTTRRAVTTVELTPGDSFMIAGLLKNDSGADIDSVPGLGNIPILNLLFRSAAFKRNESELVVVVTPYIAQASDEKSVKLPTDNQHFPGMMEMFMLGRLETNSVKSSNSGGLEGRTGFIAE